MHGLNESEGCVRMIATHSTQNVKDHLSQAFADELVQVESENKNTLSKVQNASDTQLLLPGRNFAHNTQSGLNPVVDAASYLFSVLGKLKQLKAYHHLSLLKDELILEINTFQESLQTQAYNAEYAIVCRYILCATFDDIISNTVWGSQGQWESHSLLNSFNPEGHQEDKFFTIMERAVKEPNIYIDLMELMYICLSSGYKGHYRATEHSQYQLEQIHNHLFKHIRAYRGNFSKALSPAPFKFSKIAKKSRKNNTSFLLIGIVTTCVIMTIFISLGYLMDVISNEAYSNILQIENTVSHDNSRL